MSVRPVEFYTDGTLLVRDEGGACGKTAILPLDALSLDARGRFLFVTCPTCGAVSCHPVGGGAAPTEVQAAFILKYARDPRLAVSSQDAFAKIKAAVEAMDGAGRFRYSAVSEVLAKVRPRPVVKPGPKPDSKPDQLPPEAQRA